MQSLSQVCQKILGIDSLKIRNLNGKKQDKKYPLLDKISQIVKEYQDQKIDIESLQEKLSSILVLLHGPLLRVIDVFLSFEGEIDSIRFTVPDNRQQESVIAAFEVFKKGTSDEALGKYE